MMIFSILIFGILSGISSPQAVNFPGKGWSKYDSAISYELIDKADYVYKAESDFPKIFLKEDHYGILPLKEWEAGAQSKTDSITFQLIDKLSGGQAIMLNKDFSIWGKSSMKLKYGDEVFRILTVIPTEKGSINIYGFLTKDDCVNQFQSYLLAVNSINIPDSIKYNPKSDWAGYVEMILTGMLIGETVILLFLLFKSPKIIRYFKRVLAEF